jgi:glutaredoxin
MGKYVLYVTRNCSTCERVKNLIRKMNLDIEVKRAGEEEIKEFRNQKILSFPVLADENLNITAHGTTAGYYIVENEKIFKQKSI